jgi:DNA-binding FadR family transcriptional regulator
MIKDPQFQNGKLLPNEVDLANQLAISRTTLRQALNKLVYEGMATIDWKLIGKIEAFRIEVGEIGDAARNDLYLVGVSIFNG